MKQKRLISVSLIYGIGSILEKSVAFFLIPVYTHFLSTQEYGYIALILAVLNILQVFALAPANSGFIRYYYSPEVGNRQKVLVFNSLFLILVHSAIVSFIFFNWRQWICSVILSDESLTSLISIYALTLFFRPVSAFLVNFLRIKEMARAFVLVNISRFALSLILTIYLIAELKMGLYAVALGELFLTLFPVLVLFTHLVLNIEYKFSMELIRKVLSYGYPWILSNISNNIIQWSDRYILRFLTSVSLVGVYALGYQFSSILNFALVVPLKQAFQPLVLKLEKNPEEQRLFLSRACTYFMLVGTGIWLFLSLFSQLGIRIMARDESFHAGWIIVPIISFSYLLHGLGDFFSWGIIMKKKSWSNSGIVLLIAGINIGLNFLLIPLWGIVGAALATLACYLVWDFLKFYYSLKFYNLNFEIKRLTHITATGCLLYVFSLVFDQTLSTVANISIKSLLIIVYPFVLFFTGFFHKEEKEYISRYCKIFFKREAMAISKKL